MKNKIINYFYDDPDEADLTSMYASIAGIVTIVVCFIARLIIL